MKAALHRTPRSLHYVKDGGAGTMSCENCEEAYVIDKLAKLLAEIAVIVNGPEPPLTSWSYHDLPEKVRALKQAPPAASNSRMADALRWIVRYADTPERAARGPHRGMAAIKHVAERALEQAPPAAAVPPERDWTMIQSGNTSIPAWVVHYANAIGAYMKARHAGHWAVGPVQSREQAPPAPAVPADDSIEAAYWDFDARHKGYGPHKITPQSERDAFKWAVRAMLAAERKGE